MQKKHEINVTRMYKMTERWDYTCNFGEYALAKWLLTLVL